MPEGEHEASNSNQANQSSADAPEHAPGFLPARHRVFIRQKTQAAGTATPWRGSWRSRAPAEKEDQEQGHRRADQAERQQHAECGHPPRARQQIPIGSGCGAWRTVFSSPTPTKGSATMSPVPRDVDWPYSTTASAAVWTDSQGRHRLDWAPAGGASQCFAYLLNGRVSCSMGQREDRLSRAVPPDPASV